MSFQVDLSSKSATNLVNLQREDDQVIGIVGEATHVAAYLFDSRTTKWERMGVEGAVFVTKRKVSPLYSVFIFNRIGPDNFKLDVASITNIKLQLPYLMIRYSTSGAPCILGLWFHSDAERGMILESVNRCMDNNPDVATINSNPPPSIIKSPADLLTDREITKLNSTKSVPNTPQSSNPFPATILSQLSNNNLKNTNGGTTATTPAMTPPQPPMRTISVKALLTSVFKDQSTVESASLSSASTESVSAQSSTKITTKSETTYPAFSPASSNGTNTSGFPTPRYLSNSPSILQQSKTPNVTTNNRMMNNMSTTDTNYLTPTTTTTTSTPTIDPLLTTPRNSQHNGGVVKHGDEDPSKGITAITTTGDLAPLLLFTPSELTGKAPLRIVKNIRSTFTPSSSDSINGSSSSSSSSGGSENSPVSMVTSQQVADVLLQLAADHDFLEMIAKQLSETLR